jgi:hypothetical protein
VQLVIRTESTDATSDRGTRDAMKKQKVEDGRIGCRPVELLIFCNVDADFLTRPRCEHISSYLRILCLSCSMNGSKFPFQLRSISP